MSDIVVTNTNCKQYLKEALIREALAVFKYMVFADKADAEGLHAVAKLFREISMQELEHGKLWFERLAAHEITADNLIEAASGENDETKSFYPELSEAALKEGCEELATRFKEVGEVEEEHMKRFMQVFERIKGHELFTAPMEVKWRCTNCGYVHVGTSAPNECPACLHEQGYFERV